MNSSSCAANRFVLIRRRRSTQRRRFRTAVQCLAVKGNWPISLRWAFKSRPLASDSPITGLTINSLGDRISVLSNQSVAAVHNGKCTCTAENPAGVNNYTATLAVNGSHLTVLTFFFFSSKILSFLLAPKERLRRRLRNNFRI